MYSMIFLKPPFICKFSFLKKKMNLRKRKTNIFIQRKKTNNFEELSIIVASMRIDNIVAELISSSRNKAIEFIENERVLVH